MPYSFLTPVNMSGLEVRDVRAETVGALPGMPDATQAGRYVYHGSQLKFSDGTQWITLGAAGAGGPPSGTAGGDLAGSYPNPTIATGIIVDADVNGSANIAQSKIQNLTTDLAAKALGTSSVVAGAGMTGGGAISGSPTLNVIGGSGITVAADSVAADLAVLQARSEKGTASGYCPLDASSLVPTVNLPPLAVNDVFTVADQASMLALTAQVGDIAIRTDTGKTYVLSASPASTLGNWKEIMATGQVVSVNGQTGVVSLTAAQVGAPATNLALTAGAGLTGGGDLSAARTFDVGAGSGITVAADSVAVDSAVVEVVSRKGAASGYAPLDSSSKVPLANLPTLGKAFAGNVGAGTAVVVNHALNTRDVNVDVYRNSTPWDTVLCDVERTDVNNVTLRFAVSVAANAFRCVVTGV